MITQEGQGRRFQRSAAAPGVLFPGDEIIPYDLACVCCALKRPAEARVWLGKAIEAGGSAIKLRALDDPDLEPLWKGSGKT